MVSALAKAGIELGENGSVVPRPQGFRAGCAHIKEAPDGERQGFFHSSGGNMMMVGDHHHSPNYHLAWINQLPKRAIRSPGVFGDRGFIF